MPNLAAVGQQGEPGAAVAVVPAAPGEGREEATARRTSFLVGGCEALLTVAFYAVGWDRAFSYDASRTVGQFVADAAGFGDEPLLFHVCRRYAHALELPAREPGLLFAHQPFWPSAADGGRPACRVEWTRAADTSLCREALAPEGSAEAAGAGG